MENRMSRNVSTIYEDLGVKGIRYCSMLISLASSPIITSLEEGLGVRLDTKVSYIRGLNISFIINVTPYWAVDGDLYGG